MKITFVVAASDNNVIGIHNQLPWHLPDDLKFFKQKTLGKPVLMGKNTWLSLGKPLPKRLNIVLSSHLQELPDGVLVFKEIEAALQYLQSVKTEEVCVIGGGQIFKTMMPAADTIYITRVHTTIENGDAFFPEINGEWELVWEERHFKDERHSFDFTFQQWNRKAGILK